MKILVCGSRDWMDGERIEYVLKSWRPYANELIHGAARGADQLAATIGRRLNYEVRAYPADWRGKGKRAGILRNLEMLDAKPDLVIAFWKNGSTGTKHTIDEARKRGILVRIYSE